MATAIDLDPGSYRGTYKLIGGAPALDFANLVSYRGTARQHDWLVPPANVEQWRRAAGLDVPVATAPAALRYLREVLARIFLAVTDGGTPATPDIDHLGRVVASAWVRRRLEHPAGAPAARWVDEKPSLLHVVALDAASLLTAAETLERLGACHECRWVYLDETRNRSRRWCDPADCGNRARQRRHYRRRTGSRSALGDDELPP